MKKFPIADLVRMTGATLLASNATTHASSFTGVSTDSRSIEAGNCFFAVRGENFDGHDYLSDVFARGAVCAVVSRDLRNEEFAGKCLLRVDDTIKALGDLAAGYRRQAGFKVVAITGSAGKTTTRQIVHHVLSRHFRVHQSPKSFNNNIGVPLTLLGAEPDDQIIVAEIGSNHPGEISPLTTIAAPDIAVVTNVHPAHLEGFGDLQTIIKEKLSISEGLMSEGVLIINGDFKELVESCRTKGARFLTFGKSDFCDYRARDVRCEGLASQFNIDGTEINLPLAGPGNVDNALAAWAVCSQMGLTTDNFAQAVKNLPSVSMRAELLQIGTLKVLNDCYNANPASMKNALDILSGLDPAGERRLVFICGEMAELGHQAERLHAELGAAIAKTRVRLLMTVGRLAQITADNAAAKAEHDLEIKCFDDTISACNNLDASIKDYDIILVKGSRTAKLETVVEKLKGLFSLKLSRKPRNKMREAR